MLFQLQELCNIKWNEVITNNVYVRILKEIVVVQSTALPQNPSAEGEKYHENPVNTAKTHMSSEMNNS